MASPVSEQMELESLRREVRALQKTLSESIQSLLSRIDRLGTAADDTEAVIDGLILEGYAGKFVYYSDGAVLASGDSWKSIVDQMEAIVDFTPDKILHVSDGPRPRYTAGRLRHGSERRT